MTNLSTDEIVSLYLTAKDRDEQIVILAELTASDMDTILEVLKDAGVYSGAWKTCKRCGNTYPVLKYKRNQHCPECRKIKAVIDEEKETIKRNMVKIESLARENAERRKAIDEMESKFNAGGDNL